MLDISWWFIHTLYSRWHELNCFWPTLLAKYTSCHVLGISVSIISIHTVVLIKNLQVILTSLSLHLTCDSSLHSFASIILAALFFYCFFFFMSPVIYSRLAVSWSVILTDVYSVLGFLIWFLPVESSCIFQANISHCNSL